MTSGFLEVFPQADNGGREVPKLASFLVVISIDTGTANSNSVPPRRVAWELFHSREKSLAEWRLSFDGDPYTFS